MFERFTDSARAVVVAAQNEARALHHERIGTEHLLLGLLADQASPTSAVLRKHGLTLQTVRSAVAGSVGLDADALATLGIDLDAVRSTVEASFGPGALDAKASGRGRGRYDRGGHIPFSPRAKKVLELSLREAVARKDNAITEAHIMLGLIREGQGLAIKVITDRGLDLEQLRREIGSQPAA